MKYCCVIFCIVTFTSFLLNVLSKTLQKFILANILKTVSCYTSKFIKKAVLPFMGLSADFFMGDKTRVSLFCLADV